MIQKFLFLNIFLFVNFCFSSSGSDWKKLSSYLHNKSSFQIDFVRTSYNLLSSKGKKTTGVFYVLDDRFRIESKHLVIFDGKRMWLKVSSKAFKAISMKEKPYIFWELFRNIKNLKKKFKIKRNKNLFTLKPKGRSYFKWIKVRIKANKIYKISYSDGLGNKSVFKIISFKKKRVSKKLFQIN